MPSDVLVTTSELENKPSAAIKKKKNPLGLIFRILMILIIVFSLSIMGFVLISRAIYPEDIYVNGLSMYPTFNKDAKSLVVDGDYEPLYKSGETYSFSKDIKNGDLVDYGLADSKSETLKALKRFDIIVTYYPSDYQDGERNGNAIPKIKRILGLPGEKVRLEVDDTPMGALYINDQAVEQPGNDSERYNAPLKKAGIKVSYPSSKLDPNADNWAGVETILGEDEYYVAGDNRYGLSSSDSRRIGPIKREYMYAKVGPIIGLCRVGNGGHSCELDYSKLRIPWELA